MSKSLSHRLTNKLIDWLIAIFVACLSMWFILTQPVITIEPKDNSQQVNVTKLKNHVQFLTHGYAPRTLNYDNLYNTADYIYRQFSVIGIPEYQIIETVSAQYRNVSLQLGPDTNELYIIGAHYDAEDDSIDTEGNASGVATLIELARHLAENSDKLKIGVILIAYPLSLNQSDNIVNTGSYFHANTLKKKKKKVRLMISLDSVGQSKLQNNSKDRPYSLMDLLYPPENNYVNLVGRLKDFNNIRELKKGFKNTSSLSLHSINLLENFNKSQSSDHLNYWRQGFPAVLISDMTKRNKTIQYAAEPKDRLDYEKMAMLVNSLYQAVMYTDASVDEKTQLANRSRNQKAKSVFH